MKTLKINLFYNCSAKCSHCRFYCENETVVKTPDFEAAYNTAKTLKNEFSLDMAVVLGGEPMLFADDTINLINKIHSLGVATRLETNASFANTYDKAKKYLSQLQAANTQIMLSLDAFHIPFVSLDNIANTINACVELGLSFNLEMPYLDIENKNNDLDKKTEELFKELKTKINLEIPKYEGQILFIGRAVEEFANDFSKGKGVPKEICNHVPWWSDSEIMTTDLIILEPEGYITKGCGIAVGNIFKVDLTKMIKNFNANDNPIFKVLLEKGPFGLAEMAKEYGYEIKDDYADKCHLCQEARLFLKPYYNDILQPNQHYPNFVK